MSQYRTAAHLAALMFVVMPGSVFAQNIVENSSFEFPALPASPADNPPDWTSNSGDPSTGDDWWVFQSIPGWVSDAGAGIEVHRGFVGGSGPHSGEQKVELDAASTRGGLAGESTNSSLYQDLPTQANCVYELRFWYRPRTATPDDNAIEVHWDGLLVATADASDPAAGWREIVVPDLPAASTWTELRFTAAGTANEFGGYLDDVSVVPVDDSPPELACITDVIALWPPNHKMREVGICIAVSDDCTNPEALLVNCTVSSTEPDDATGDGKTAGDVDGADGFTSPVNISGDLEYDADLGCYFGVISLRAERDGAESGRVYTIVCDVLDNAGNEATASCVVVVPHDKRK